MPTMTDEELDPRELERLRRRDREADAKSRELLRPGMGKVYKQIIDAWEKHASLDQDRGRKGLPKGHDGPP